MKEMWKSAPPNIGMNVETSIGQSDEQKPVVDTTRTVIRTESPDVRSRAPFRLRLFAILLLFAVVPTITVTALWTGTASQALSLMSAGSAWERIARSGEAVFEAVRASPLTPQQLATLQTHEAELRQSVELAKRFDFVAGRTIRLIAVGALLVVVAVTFGASRVAGHLSRQLSRPLDELVGWTRLIRGERPLPDMVERRGAPEFEVLRTSMRTMAVELAEGRQRALEAERAEAFRESARRFAHELKNPLTPIRFAIERLRRSAPDDLRETVEVLAEESARLDTMARSFAQFGRLPDGPAAEIDVAEMVARTVRHTLPDTIRVELAIEESLPLVVGYYEALVRAVTNVLLNAVDACVTDGVITVTVRREHTVEFADHIVITIVDNGHGMEADILARIFDPYVTTKPGGTGLGLAIARQTMAAHHGTIEATSTVGQGTQMRLRLPISDTQG